MTSVLVFPAVSVAVTVIGLSPSTRLIAVLDVHVPGRPEVVAPLVLLAALAHVTLWMPTLSFIVPPRLTVNADVIMLGAEVGEVIVTLGAMASNVTAIESVAVLPAVSCAVTTMAFTPLASGMDADHPAAIVAEPLPPVAAFVHVTEASVPPGSDAVPARRTGATLVAKLLPLLVVMATRGGELSYVTWTWAVAVLFEVSVTVTMIVFRPAVNPTLALQLGLANAAAPLVAPFTHVTLATATLSDAVPVI